LTVLPVRGHRSLPGRVARLPWRSFAWRLLGASLAVGQPARRLFATGLFGPWRLRPLWLRAFGLWALWFWTLGFLPRGFLPLGLGPWQLL
jgi:hypothetical protein